MISKKHDSFPALSETLKRHIDRFGAGRFSYKVSQAGREWILKIERRT